MRPALRAILLVAGREVSERTNSRPFLASTLAIVVLVVGGVVLPGLTDRTKQVRVGLTGTSPAGLTQALGHAARAREAELHLRRYASVGAGEHAIRSGDANALIVDGRRLVWNAEPDPETAGAISSAVQRVEIARRAQALGLDADQAGALVAPVALPSRSLEPVDADKEARETIAFISFIVLLMMLLWYGSAVAEGVAQEKGTRVMELLVSRARPRDLLAGKVLGIGSVGLLQMLVALAAGVLAIVAFDTVDAPSAVPATLVSVVLWFTLGYAFWSVAFAAAGALVSRTEDLQAAIAPLTWTVTLSGLMAPVASEYADEWYMLLASLLPITAPFVMPVRIAVGDVAAWQILLSAAIMLISTYGLVRLGGAIYSGALLRTGERPRLRDLKRAARAAS